MFWKHQGGAIDGVAISATYPPFSESAFCRAKVLRRGCWR